MIACPDIDISVVIPVFNERENLESLHERLTATLSALEVRYEIVFVDDGSRDQTPHILAELRRSDPSLALVRLSRNFGHQAAISAGLERAQGRCVVVMDADFQDPPEVLPRFLEAWRAGNDVVYAIRQRRQENLFKRTAYAIFYRLLRAIGDIDTPLDSGDFCLMDRKVVEALTSLPERARFVRGLRTFVGFQQTGVAYDRPARAAGTPKYTFRKLFALATDGLVSFSSYPLRLVTQLGILTALMAVVGLIWVLADAFGNHTAPRGWASTFVVVLFMGSVQLLSLGIIGEYVRLIFLESKQRPTYIVAEYLPPAVPPVDRAASTQSEPAPRSSAVE